MTMHMAHAALSTTKTSGKGKKSPNTAAKRKAAEEHEAWLRQQGLHPDQLAQRKKNFKKQKAEFTAPAPTVPLSNNLKVDGGRKFSIMDLMFSDEESDATKQAIQEKASRTAPAYSKGGYQYITPGTDLSDIGKKK